MSILKKLSDVIKEVFWIKPSRQKNIPARRKGTVKKVVKKHPKKTKLVKAKKAFAAQPIKTVKSVKVAKPPKISVLVKAKAFQLDPNLVKVGEITHYFDRIKVCVVKITQGTVLIGDKLTIAGKKNKFVQKVWSMQIESQDVKVAKKGQLIGLKVDKPAEVGNVVYK